MSQQATGSTGDTNLAEAIEKQTNAAAHVYKDIETQLSALPSIAFPYGHHATSVRADVGWPDAARARDIIASSDLEITSEETTFLQANQRGQGGIVSIATTLPNRETALLLADAADAKDTELRRSHNPTSSNPGHPHLAAMLAAGNHDPANRRAAGVERAGDILFHAVHTAQLDSTLGRTPDSTQRPPHIDTLATLLLGNAGITSEYPEYGQSGLDALVTALENTPTLVDVARALEADQRETPDPLRIAAPVRGTPGQAHTRQN